jgi:peptidoglycan/LPS O-acetylase OafA/YrhL
VTPAITAAERRAALSHCPEIDSLRAIAMIGVVAMHAKLLPFGWAGVWLFFVISGYVVTLSIARSHDPRRPAEGAMTFLQQRIGRILPAYYVYLITGLVVSLALAIPQPGFALVSLFGFFHNVAMAGNAGDLAVWPVGHLWTISIEMQFYLVYGLFAYFAPLAVTKRMLWACIIIAPLGRLVAGLLLSGTDPEAAAYAVYSAPGLHFDSFALGCLFALSRLTVPLDTLVKPIVRTGLGALGLYLLSYVAINLLVRDRNGVEVVKDIISGILFGEGREVFLYSALGLASLAILALTVSHDPLVQRVTGLPVLQWIGRISYGGYVYHALALRIACWMVAGTWVGIGELGLAGRLTVFALALAMTLGVAQLSWLYLEKPAARWVKSVWRLPAVQHQAPTPA